MPDVSVIIPSRERPIGLLRAIVAVLLTTKGYDVEIIPVLDVPDKESRHLMSTIPGLVTVVMPDSYIDGHPQQKFQAGYEAATSDWIATGADDTAFHPGWLEAMFKHPNHGIIGFYDSCHKGKLSTLYMLSREYIETRMNGRLGLPWYHVWGSDRETMMIAKRQGVFTICKEAGFDHFHPNQGTAVRDKRTLFASQWWARDMRTYQAREKAGFPEHWPEV